MRKMLKTLINYPAAALLLASLFSCRSKNMQHPPSKAPASAEYLKLFQKSGKQEKINLIRNGSFGKLNAKEWHGASIKDLTVVEDNASGRKCAKIKLTLKPKWGPQYDRALISQKLDIPSGNYLFSCRLKGENLTDFKAALSGLCSNGKRKDFRKHIGLLNASKWKECSFVFSLPKGFKADKLGIEFLGKRGKECVAYFEDAKLFKEEASSNKIFNSSFEICTSPETPDRWVSSAAKLLAGDRLNTTLVTDTAKTGSNSIKMTWKGPFDENFSYCTRLMSGYCPDVEEGEKYTVSLWMKTDNPPVKMNLWMNYVNRKTITVDSKEWKRYTFTSEWRKPYRKTRFAFILLFFAGKNGQPINANVWVDDIMAVSGEMPAKWEPSLLDKIYLERGMPPQKQKAQKKKNKTKDKYPELSATKRSDEIKIDGQLNEASWKKAQAAKAETPYKKTPVSNDTLCKISYDDQFMYISFDAKEKPQEEAKGNGGVFSGDWIEFFLDPNEKDNVYYQFVINNKGKFFTSQCFFDPISFEVAGASGYTMNRSWQPKIDYAVKDSKDGWIAEIKIPLNLFKSELKQDAPFRMNFYRVFPGTKEMNCWSKPSKNFHTIIDYGYLKGLETPRKYHDIKFSETVFTPEPETNEVCGRFAISGQDSPEKITVEMLTPKKTPQKLKTSRNGNSVEFKIHLPPKDAKNKFIRIKAYAKKEDKTPAAQNFAEVNIVTLLTMGLNNLVFTDEKSFPCRIIVRLPESELKKCKLEISARKKGAQETLLKKTFDINSKDKTYNLSFKNLQNSFYILDASLTLNGKPLAKTSKWTYLGSRRKNYSRTNVNNYYLENKGKPFLLLSAWQANPVAGVNLENLGKYRKTGFNCIWAQLSTYRTPYEKMEIDKLFEMAKKNDLYVIIDFCALMTNGEKRHKYSHKRIREIILENVKKYKNHPNLLMYHGMDEWWAGRSKKRPFCSEDELEDIYWLVRKEDPYHAFFFNLGPRPQAWFDLRFTDIFSYDCYVRANAPNEFDLDRFIFYLNHGKRCAADEGKPMFTIIQFDSGTEVQQSRMLTCREQRCLNYVSLLNQAKGLGYFTGICWCDAKNKELAKINREIESLSPILLAYEKRYDIETGNDSIQAKCFKYKGEHFLIALNISNKNITSASLKMDNAFTDAKTLEGVFDDSSCEAANGKIILSFAPYECKVMKCSE